MDTIKKIGNSLIQHGKHSDRVYLMKLDQSDLPDVTEEINRLVQGEQYTKVFAKVSEENAEFFISDGYLTEAVVPGLFGENKTGCFMAKYFSVDRKEDRYQDYCKGVLDTALRKTQMNHLSSSDVLSKEYVLRQLTKDDVPDAAVIYRKVFTTYPFPIHKESYLLETMEDNLIYFGIWKGNKLIALSSIETSKKDGNAEMTDFAVLEEYRGVGFARYLLDYMEGCLQKMGYHTAYTIARAKSYGMNITFAKNNYIYAGTLLNNTQIAGQIESMNVWYKKVAK